ncbi:MAG: hypothetical protein JSR39_05010 [Verrucomicrobia bacterium]|nr:hypothetical protein [Verrucomicrobiota bacterium]
MKYHLAEACQNTFVLFDCLGLSKERPGQLETAQTELHTPSTSWKGSVSESLLDWAHSCLQNEDRDDALILVEDRRQGEDLYARMVVLGLDRNLGEFCGNGSRACAAYLFAKYPHFKKFFLVTPFGVHPLKKWGDGTYSIKLPLPSFEINLKFIAAPEVFGMQYVEVIEPHLVIQADLDDEELFLLGKKLNQHKEIFPLGINVNAWHVIGDHHLHVKTYERGVQRLTKSCGTGSIACAASFLKQGRLKVSTPGGDLEIAIENDGVLLKGPASFFDIDKKERAG